MTDVPVTFRQVECNGDTPPENGQQPITKINEETSNVDGTSSYCRVEPSLEDLPSEVNQKQSETLQGTLLLNYSTDEKVVKENPEENLYIVHKAITDLSLQEKSVDEMTFREVINILTQTCSQLIRPKQFTLGNTLTGKLLNRLWSTMRTSHKTDGKEYIGTSSYCRVEPHLEDLPSEHQWKKIPLSSSNQEISRQKERIIEQPLEEREDDNGKNKSHHATEIEWLGFRKPSQVDVLHSKHDEEQEVWDEEINDDDDDCNEDEDEVRVIEFKKKREYSELKEEGDVSEDSPLSSPSSQPVTPDEHPTLVKRSDISRNAYSRYNTISYRKIRKGNTKQRIDEFESMMNL